MSVRRLGQMKFQSRACRRVGLELPDSPLPDWTGLRAWPDGQSVLIRWLLDGIRVPSLSPATKPCTVCSRRSDLAKSRKD